MIEDVVAAKIYEYQFSLITRRWQSLLAFFVISGLMLNSLGLIIGSQWNDVDKNNFALCLGVVGVVLSILMARIVDLMTYRVHLMQEHIIKKNIPPIILGVGNKASLTNVTSILFIIITLLAIPWLLVVLNYSNLWVMLLLIMLLVVNLCFVSWKTNS